MYAWTDHGRPPALGDVLRRCTDSSVMATGRGSEDGRLVRERGRRRPRRVRPHRGGDRPVRRTDGCRCWSGPGDDAAVLRAPDGGWWPRPTCWSRAGTSAGTGPRPRDVGRKAAAQNLADVAAMGARPTALLVGLAVPPDLPAAWPPSSPTGCGTSATRSAAAVVGGDVVRSDVLVLAVTALGDLQGRDAGDCAPARGRATWSRTPAGWAGPLPGWPCCRAGSARPGRWWRRTAGPQPPYEHGPARCRARAPPR